VTRPLAPRFLASLALATLGLAAPSAVAQPADPQKLAVAQALFERAQAAMDKKDYASACPKLEEVTRILPNGVGGQLTLAQCYEGAGRLASAWTTYVIAQAAAARANRPEQEKQARVRAEAVKPRLAELAVTVAEALRSLPGLAVERDGAPVGAAQWGVPLPVDKGKHVVVATAPGKQRWEKTVEVPADGTTVSVEVAGVADVEPVAVVAEPPPPPVPPPAPAWSGLRIGGVVLGGAGLVGIGVGSAFGAVAIARKNQSSSQCGAGDQSTDPNKCTSAGTSLRSEGLRAASISTGAFVAGGIALAGGITLFVVAPQRVEVRVGVGLGAIEVAGAW
jgi:hypothetical protein